MRIEKVIELVFFALLTGFLCNGCSNDDLPAGNSSGSASCLGTICFNAENSAQTKGSDGKWKTINVPLNAGTQNRGKEPVHPSACSVLSSLSVFPEDPTLASVASSLTRGVPVLGTDGPGGSFGVCGYLLSSGIWNNSVAAPSFMYNTQLTRSGTFGSYSYNYYPTKYWPDNTSDLVRFFAYYPYNGDGIHLSSSTDTGYPVISYTPNATITNQVDLMYAYTNAVNNKETGAVVNFNFNHALTRVCFSINKSPECASDKLIVQSISLTGIANKGVLSLDPSLTNPWTLSSSPADAASYTASTENGALIPSVNQAFNTVDYLPVTALNGYFMLLPQNITSANKVIVNFTVNGEARITTLDLPSATWTGGQCINYQLTLSDPSIKPLTTGSNCYILKPSATTTAKYTLPISRVNEYWGSTGPGNNPNYMIKSTDTWAVSVVWQDVYGLINLVTSTGTGPDALAAIQIPANAKGNAVIGIKKTSGSGVLNVYLWSWHIWVTDYDSNATNIAFNNLTWMDRNLGATSAQPGAVETLGLLYQWGRKDPFPASSSVSSGIEPVIYNSIATTTISIIPFAVSYNLINSINNPATYYDDYYSGKDWGTFNNNTLWNDSKTIYDPCPSGWKVPSSNAWSPYPSFTWSATLHGCTYTGSPGFFYPAAGGRGPFNGILSNVGQSVNLWSSTADSSGAYSFNYSTADVKALAKASGYSVRCVKE